MVVGDSELGELEDDDGLGELEEAGMLESIGPPDELCELCELGEPGDSGTLESIGPLGEPGESCEDDVGSGDSGEPAGELLG